MGIMKRSLEKLIEVGFIQYELDKIVIRVAVGNTKSSNIPMKLGFKHDGTLRHDIKINGEIQDLNVYSLLRSEYVRKEK